MRPNQGFTLFELLIVVVMIGILAAAGIPMFMSDADLEVQADASRIEATIRHVQALAAERDLEFKVVFLTGDRLVTVDRIYAGPIPALPDKDAYDWNLRYAIIVSADFGGVNRIEFDAKGRVKTSGWVTIDCNGAVIDGDNDVNDRGKILPRRISGTSAKYQRQLSQAIKRARIIALLPYVSSAMK